MVRRTLVPVLVVPFLVSGSAFAHTLATREPAASPPAATFFISGRGWGHGVGMSQWGAYGFAQRGWPYDRILAHYFRGTELGKVAVARVRVLLGEGRKSVKIASPTPFRVRDGAGQTHELEAGAYTFGPGLRLKIDPAKDAEALPAPLVFLPGAAPLEYRRPYRGQIQVNLGNGRLQVVNSVGLEAYLDGVVPREVPFTWPEQALKAQAVVARSYALAVRRAGAFDVFPDTRSQVYGGIEAEKPTTTAAVDATAGQVLLFEGRVATTYFFSTSGGRTASIEDVWANGEPVPYLVSVPDPYDSASPHHQWGPFVFGPAKLQKTFHVPGRLVDVRLEVNSSQRADTVTFVGSRGEVTVAGAEVRNKLGLRSTWFRVGLLSLDRPTAPLEYGSQTRLTGLVRASPRVTLEQRVSGNVWEPAARVAPTREGKIDVTVRPLVSTDYRLAASASVAGGRVRLLVAPRVRFRAVTEQTGLRGLVRPVVRGAPVQIQRLTGSVWRTVATAEVDASGSFEAGVQLTPGTYRARCAPGRGLVPGYSPLLKVVS